MMSERLGRWQFWLHADRLQSDLRADARRRAAGHAAADLHLFGRSRLDDLESADDRRRGGPGRRVLLFFWNLFVSCRRGEPAGDDPWDAWTLEWATTSPPAPYNFETIPVVRSRRPLWDLKHPDDPDWDHE